jgi:hypothetical protein
LYISLLGTLKEYLGSSFVLRKDRSTSASQQLDNAMPLMGPCQGEGGRTWVVSGALSANPCIKQYPDHALAAVQDGQAQRCDSASVFFPRESGVNGKT